MIEYAVDGRTRRAPLWVPAGFDLQQAGTGWIVFLHAYEERGEDGEHLEVGLGPVLVQDPELYRVPVLMPQCPAGLVWSAADEPWYRGEPIAEHHVDAVIAAAAERYPALGLGGAVLTGASMGGFATLLYGGRRPELFRGFHAVCGGGDPDRLGALSQHPVWLHHAADDDVVPVESSRRMAEALRARAPNAVCYSEYPAGGHACWEQAYRDPAVARFLATANLPSISADS